MALALFLILNAILWTAVGFTVGVQATASAVRRGHVDI